MFSAALNPKTITYESFQEIIKLSPRRICFSSYHKTALSKNTDGKYLGKFVLPFKESILQIFESETDLTLFNSYDKYFHSIKNGEEKTFDKIQSFVTKYNDVVFLRDCIDISVALSENINDKNELTKIGELEDRAKYKGDESAVDEISNICYSFITQTPYYKNADLICAVPPSNPINDNLPRKVIRVMTEVKEKDISATMNWAEEKPRLKDLELEKKWQTLEKYKLLIETDVKGKSVILIDDLYQSGTTMQYVAMKLKEVGATYVFGLSFVKARNDKDYV